MERVLQEVSAHDLSVETPEPILRFGLGFAIERALELPNFIRSSYFRSHGTISLSFAPLTRLRTSRGPSPSLEPGQMFRGDVPRFIVPALGSLTMASSDCGADASRLTGRAGLWLIRSTLPALSVVALPDVPATPTPPETARADGYPPRRHRPSSSHQ